MNRLKEALNCSTRQKVEVYEISRPQIISIFFFQKQYPMNNHLHKETRCESEVAETISNRIRPTEISDIENTGKSF